MRQMALLGEKNSCAAASNTLEIIYAGALSKCSGWRATLDLQSPDTRLPDVISQ
jgi:hypothetical protein